VAPPGALAAAAEAGETSTIVMLVEALGGDVDAAEPTTARTPLHAAAASRHIDTVHALLQVLRECVKYAMSPALFRLQSRVEFFTSSM